MSDRLADFLIDLAEDDAARAAFEASPHAELVARGFSADEQAALLCNDDARVMVHITKPFAPVVAKIFTGVGEQPEEAPAVAKIFTGVGEQPDETPAVAKIFTGVGEQPEEIAPRRVAKRA